MTLTGSHSSKLISNPIEQQEPLLTRAKEIFEDLGIQTKIDEVNSALETYNEVIARKKELVQIRWKKARKRISLARGTTGLLQRLAQDARKKRQSLDAASSPKAPDVPVSIGEEGEDDA